MAKLILGNESAAAVSRRGALKLGAGATGSALIPGFFGQIGRAYADDKAPVGTWPAGTEGDTLTIGAAVPRTGAYAVQGEDELKGMQLAIEHLNEGNDLVKQIAPKVTKGVLGKHVNLVVAEFGRQTEQRRARATSLHQPEQDHRHDRLDLVSGRRGFEQVRPA